MKEHNFLKTILTCRLKGSSVVGFSLTQQAWTPLNFGDPERGNDDKSLALRTINVESQSARSRSNADADLKKVTGDFCNNEKYDH